MRPRDDDEREAQREDHRRQVVKPGQRVDSGRVHHFGVHVLERSPAGITDVARRGSGESEQGESCDRYRARDGPVQDEQDHGTDVRGRSRPLETPIKALRAFAPSQHLPDQCGIALALIGCPPRHNGILQRKRSASTRRNLSRLRRQLGSPIPRY